MSKRDANRVLWLGSPMRQFVCFSIPLILACATVACSPKNIGINRMADALSSTATSYSRDDDPEFVRLAAPSTLKMVEMLLDSQPAHPGLLMTACGGFTQDRLRLSPGRGRTGGGDGPCGGRRAARAGAADVRACPRVLRACARPPPSGDRRVAETPERDARHGEHARDVPALFWLGAAVGGAVSIAEVPLQRMGELVTVRAVLGRALVLDEAWERGAIHEAMIALDGLPPLLGGSAARAREHFDRAVELSKGVSALAYVTMAASVARPAKDRAEFERLLRAALAIDVSREPAPPRQPDRPASRPFPAVADR